MRVRAYYSKTYTTAHEAAAVIKFRITEYRTSAPAWPNTWVVWGR